jgi:sulfopyruvate decarboxylase subunit alpha
LTSSVALGVALGLPHRKVIAFDGDGALLMNLCGLPTIARKKPRNMVHVVFDNGVYESSGANMTATATGVDLVAVAKAVGIAKAFWARSLEEFKELFRIAMNGSEHTFIGAKIEPGRGDATPLPLRDVENKYRFIRHVEKTEGKVILDPWIPVSMRKSGGVSDDSSAANVTQERILSGASDSKNRAKAILAGLKQAGINFVAHFGDINLVNLIAAVEEDEEIVDVPLCREEEGIGICEGAYLAGKKPALIMQNEGLFNSCNAIVTTAIQMEIPILMLIYYAGDIGDQGFPRTGSATIPILEALGVRYYLLRKAEETNWTLTNAQILCENSERPLAVLLTKDVLGKR